MVSFDTIIAPFNDQPFAAAERRDVLIPVVILCNIIRNVCKGMYLQNEHDIPSSKAVLLSGLTTISW
jgi:hypothetical protein